MIITLITDGSDLTKGRAYKIDTIDRPARRGETRVLIEVNDGRGIRFRETPFGDQVRILNLDLVRVIETQQVAS